MDGEAQPDNSKEELGERRQANRSLRGRSNGSLRDHGHLVEDHIHGSLRDHIH